MNDQSKATELTQISALIPKWQVDALDQIVTEKRKTVRRYYRTDALIDVISVGLKQEATP